MTKRRVGRIVLVVGALVVAYGAVRWWHGERVFARMRATTCTLLSKKVESKLRVDTGSRRRGIGGSQRAWYEDEAHLVFAHTLDGRQYSFTEERVPHAGYEEGKPYPCRYDPQDPRRATVTTGFDSGDDVQTIFLGGVLIVFGAMIPHRNWRRD